MELHDSATNRRRQRSGLLSLQSWHASSSNSGSYTVVLLDETGLRRPWRGPRHQRCRRPPKRRDPVASNPRSPAGARSHCAVGRGGRATTPVRTPDPDRSAAGVRGACRGRQRALPEGLRRVRVAGNGTLRVAGHRFVHPLDPLGRIEPAVAQLGEPAGCQGFCQLTRGRRCIPWQGCSATGGQERNVSNALLGALSAGDTQTHPEPERPRFVKPAVHDSRPLRRCCGRRRSLPSLDGNFTITLVVAELPAP